MKLNKSSTRSSRRPEVPSYLQAALSRKVVGQAAAISGIAPFIEMYQAGLNPPGRPAGVFLLLGPTGTGKTRTVEALAELLHGSSRNMIKVDCGEFQMEHEVAKLVGAPPGYLGHRETQPLLSQSKLTGASSEKNSLSLILFDEIEKAASSMTRILLGILDKATLRLGDNSTVNFERSMIFLTSNLGAQGINAALRPGFGFGGLTPRPAEDPGPRLESIALAAVRRKFSPEFVNRLDRLITYQPLGPGSLAEIVTQCIDEMQTHINNRLGPHSFHVEIPARTRKFLLRHGTSAEYGAREIKRTLTRHIMQPLASLLAAGGIPPGSVVRADTLDETIRLRVLGSEDAVA